MNKIQIINIICIIITVICFFAVACCDNNNINRYIIAFQWVVILVQLGLSVWYIRKI